MQRLPVTSGGLAAEQTRTANVESATQAVASVNASRESKFGVGNFFDATAHKAAIPSMVFILVGGGLLFWLIYRSHLSLSASLGRG